MTTNANPEEKVSSWEDISGILTQGINRGKKLRAILLGSFVVDLVLTAGLLYNTEQLHHAEQRVAVATCISTNHAREDNRHLWDYVLNLIDKNGKPTKVVLNFENYLNKATAQKECRP